jgi:cation:H+ antiporter
MNLVLLAVVDAAISECAVTSAVPGMATVLQGTLGIVALAITAAAIATGDSPVLGVGAGAALLFIFVVFGFWIASRYAVHSPWRADRSTKKRSNPSTQQPPPPIETELERQPLARLLAVIAGFAIVILFAGFLLSETADAIAAKTGVGANFVGLVLVGFATALPNLSSIVGAVRLERYEMAISDVFGANLFNLGLILLADIVFKGTPILSHGGPFEIVASLIGIVLTAIYLMGLLERENRTIFGMGYDSFAVLWVYAAGLALLYVIG